MASEKTDKTKINSQIKHVPKDAQVIMSILRELNIQEYEPRVVNQLLEFTYRYVTCILDDAKVFANHARKKTIDLDDVKLATEVVLDKAFTVPPSRSVLTKLAEVRNAMPLPPVKPLCGLRLPPDRYCLTAVNYKLRAANQPKKMTKSALEGRSNIKTTVKPVSNANALKRPHAVIPKQQVVTIPKPVIKFTTKTVTPTETVKTEEQGRSADVKMDVGGMETVGASVSGLKRDREVDELEMAD